MQPEGLPNLTATQLPRGGTLVEGQGFRMQIGSYPETIKDTMKSAGGVPDLFLLPDILFDFQLGVSNSDLEFPLYFNFFIKGKKCRFLCHRHQLRPVYRVLREAVSGPFQLFTEDEFVEGSQTPGYPDLKKEMAFYKEDPQRPGGRLRLKHMVEITTFDDQGQAEIDGVCIQSLGRNRYRLSQHGETLECEFLACKQIGCEDTTASPDLSQGFYQPPCFGVTVIGSGHGFDADSKTSGFILWADGKGILVDPPVNSTLWLQQNRINTRMIEDLVLTHCHADHDSGTLQKILEEGRIRLHTTPTVLESFVAKYSSLTGLHPRDFKTLFEFQPVKIASKTNIAGAHFTFGYTLHPIPTLGFQVEFEGKSFYYSCDTLYDPDLIRTIHEKGVLSQSRMEDLLNVPWESSLLFHEAGIPPIHTPLSVLAALPEEVKQRLFLTHVSVNAIPPESGLRIAIPGPENSLEIPVPPPAKSLASKILDVVCHIDLFADMKFKKALECLTITHYCTFEPGETLIRRDSYGDKFFMVLSGEVEVIHESLPRRLFFGRYDYIGETALILNQPRNADIVATTHGELLYIEREDFLRFVADTPLPNIFRRLDENRSMGARWTFEKNRILAALSPLQKNQLMCAMVHGHWKAGEYLFREGESLTRYFVIDSGQVRMRRGSSEALLGPGDLIGELGDSYEASHYSAEARAETDLRLYTLAVEDMQAFFRSNPGTFVRLSKALSETLKHGGCPRAGL